MEWVETTGNTLEAAKETALDELGVDEQDAEFEVLQEPKTGLFGRVRAEARIRARVRPTAPRAKEDRRDRRRSRPKESSDETESASATAAEGAESTRAGNTTQVAERPADAGGGRPRRNAGRQAASTRNDGPADAAGPSDDGDDQAVESPESRAGSRSRRGGRGRGGGGRSNGDTERSDGNGAPDATSERVANGARNGSRRGAAAEDDTAGGVATRVRSGGRGGPSRSNDRAGEGPTVDVALEEQGRVAGEFLQGLLTQFGLQADIAVVQPDDDNVELAITGADLGLLIGPKGATLLAIQDLTRTVVQRKTSAGNGRIHVDVSGYRQKRAAALSNFARQVASQVVATGERRALEPMAAADRKVVHDALTDFEGVETLSEGEDPHRRVVIVPAG
jgi:spoIIIJ-associated protein